MNEKLISWKRGAQKAHHGGKATFTIESQLRHGKLPLPATANAEIGGLTWLADVRVATRSSAVQGG